jgi:hypothetical protein
MFVVLPPVNCGVGVNIALRENGGESKSVVAVDEVVMYVINL